MKKHYSPNHPAVRHRQRDNYHTPYMEQTIAHRREAVRKRLGYPPKRSYLKTYGVIAGVSFFLAVGFVEEKPLWAVISVAVTLVASLPLFKELNK